MAAAVARLGAAGCERVRGMASGLGFLGAGALDASAES
jgi:hypothetical protein